MVVLLVSGSQRKISAVRPAGAITSDRLAGVDWTMVSPVLATRLPQAPCRFGGTKASLIPSSNRFDGPSPL